MKSILPVVYSCALSVSCVFAQMNGGSASAGNGSLSNGKWSSSAVPVRTLISGTVKTDDGSSLPNSVNIQLVCGGAEMTVAQTNVLNDFEFQIRTGGEMGTPGPATSFSLLSSANSDAGSVRGASSGPINNCDLRAELAGYRSSTLHLGNARAFDGINAGIVWLHPVRQSGAGHLVSISTLAAAKGAVKEFEKGKELARISKLAEAAACLRKAVEIDSRFAEAWLRLGTVQYRMHATSEAETSLLRAREIDAKMPGIYQILGYMAYDRKDWDATVRYLDQAERLNPMGAALPWYVSAVAYYQLHRLSDAERSIREEMKMDPQLQLPRAQYLLGLILIEKGDLYGGTQALRAYLAAAPDARDAAKAKSVLARTEMVAAK